jgi:hypothetical protein
VEHTGYVAEGVVYVLIGTFALMAALEPSQQPNGYKGAFAKLAVWRLLGFGGAADGGHSQAVWTARAMALPLGRWMTAATGAGIALFGVFQWYR